MAKDWEIRVSEIWGFGGEVSLEEMTSRISSERRTRHFS